MKVIIIGGVAAGMTAAAKLRRLDKDVIIHVYEKGRDLSYSGCGMPYVLGDVVTDQDKLIAKTYEEFQKQDIKVFLMHEVFKVDPKEKIVHIKDLDKDLVIKDTYDKLLIATGAYAKRTHIPGSDKIDVHVLNQFSDMKLLKPKIDKALSIAIIGGGYIGIELAENLINLKKEVYILQKGDYILKAYDKDISKKALDALTRSGVHVHLNQDLKSYTYQDDQILIKTNKNTFKVDLVIEAIGVSPNTNFLKDTGIDMLDHGAMITNRHMQTSIDDIYAAGDCVAYYHQIKDSFVYMPLGTHANKTGKVAANHMFGIDDSFSGIVGSNILKVCDLTFAKTGLGIDEAKKLNLNYDFVDITAKHQTSYYPGATDLFIRLVYEKDTTILKGAQLVGENGVSDRINIMALAITKQMTAKAFAELDFAYAPPFSPVWDPLLIAASQIK